MRPLPNCTRLITAIRTRLSMANQLNSAILPLVALRPIRRQHRAADCSCAPRPAPRSCGAASRCAGLAEARTCCGASIGGNARTYRRHARPAYAVAGVPLPSSRVASSANPDAVDCPSLHGHITPARTQTRARRPMPQLRRWEAACGRSRPRGWRCRTSRSRPTLQDSTAGASTSR